MRISVGTAGWTIPRQNAALFPDEGSSLQRYATRLCVAEINSSFHREHRLSTWERWRDSTPGSFRFSVKVPKTITHQAKLEDSSQLTRKFLEQAAVLGEKLAIVLVQLPPKLSFEAQLATRFFEELKAHSPAKIACEPRNPSWFTAQAGDLLEKLEIARVAADPAICEAASIPGGWRELHYWRLHGAPILYRSSYASRIEQLADQVTGSARRAAENWCIFDNTASSAALSDALAMEKALRDRLET
jgi:uncharacterized protein YecE (DUF72 family)